MSSSTLQQNRPNEQNQSTEIVKSKYWFEDGNVVLQAENSQFRVHLSMLAHHSSVFKDMLGIPQPPENNASIEGCPVVVLNDKAMDVEHMISVLYDNFKTNHVREPMSFDHLAAILRLGKKYDIDHFYSEGLRRIRTAFPTSQPKWKDICRNGTVEIAECEGYLEKVINLAHELSIESILPTAYFLYALKTTPDKLFGVFHSNVNNATCLPNSAIRACLLGHEQLHHISHLLSIELWTAEQKNPSRKKCLAPEDCKEGACAFSSMKSFCYYVTGLERNVSNDSLCENCRTNLSDCFEQIGACLWQSLPGIFSLRGWDELKDFDA